MSAAVDRTFFVSGAGPAGLAAALTIQKSRGHAVVFEHRGDVGGRFHGDFQGIENWTTERDALEELDEIGVEPSFEHTAFREGLFFGPDGREHNCRAREPLFYLIRRGSESGTLDSSLKEQALAAGAEIRFREGRDHLPEGGVVAQGPHVPFAIAVGYVFETDGADGVFGALSDDLAPRGYSYLLISRGRGTIASCMFDDFHRERAYLERTVDFFRDRIGISITNPRPFGGLGYFDLPPRARRGSLLFAGEAAGFQDALWGFGMRYAMLSGHLAAKALVEGEPASYDRLWGERLAGLMRTSATNRYFYQRLGPRGYRALLRRVGSAEDPRDWLRRHHASRVWKSLLSPLARRSLRSSRAALCEMEGCDCTWCRCHRENVPAQSAP